MFKCESARRALTATLWFWLAVGGPAGVERASAVVLDPVSEDWGGWARTDADAVYVHWDVFDACTLAGGFCVAGPDSEPDVAASGIGSATLTPLNAGAFITGNGAGGNIYSFADIASFNIALTGTPTGAAGRAVTVAVQVEVLGSDVAEDSLRLNGLAFSERRTLAEGEAGGEFGGIDNTYLYLWQDIPVAAAYSLDLLAASSSLSLEALSIDIAPPTSGPLVPVDPPMPEPPAAGDVDIELLELLMPVIAALAQRRQEVMVAEQGDAINNANQSHY